MSFDDLSKPFHSSIIHDASRFFALLFLPLLSLAVLTGCDSSGDSGAENAIDYVEISPDDASIEVGETIDFDVQAISSSGEIIPNADLEFTWWSTDTSVFTVEEGGTVTGQEAGTAYCMLEAAEPVGSKTASIRFTGRDSAFAFVF